MSDPLSAGLVVWFIDKVTGSAFSSFFNRLFQKKAKSNSAELNVIQEMAETIRAVADNTKMIEPVIKLNMLLNGQLLKSAAELQKAREEIGELKKQLSATHPSQLPPSSPPQLGYDPAVNTDNT
jgi:hypothetical protein